MASAVTVGKVREVGEFSWMLPEIGCTTVVEI